MKKNNKKYDDIPVYEDPDKKEEWDEYVDPDADYKWKDDYPNGGYGDFG